MKFYLGRVPSPYDHRDYNLENYMPKGILKLNLSFSKNWAFNAEPLYQGDFPHCVGFSMASFGINLPIQTPYTDATGHAFYYMCKILDGEPDAETGSNIRSAAKVLKTIGRINTYAFASNITIIKYWLLNKGPMIAGTIWTADMFTPDKDNIIHPTGEVAGGHAYLLNEWTKDGYIGIQNSWNGYWGIKGKAYIHYQDFEKLLRQYGEVLAAVELPPKENKT
jgi:hypothetical protein